MRRRWVAAAVAATAVVLPSCTPADSQPGPSPNATVQPTPPESSAARQQRVDYTAAEQAYADSLDEFERLAADGRDRPSAQLRKTASGKYLEAAKSVLIQMRDNGWRTVGRSKIVGFAPIGWQPSRVVMSVCQDVSAIRLLKGERDVTPGGDKLYVQEVTVTSSDSIWKVTDLATNKVKTFKGQPCAG